MIFVAFVLGFMTRMLIKTICGDVVEGVGVGCSAGALCPDQSSCPVKSGEGHCPEMCTGNPEGTDDVNCSGAGKYLRVDSDSTLRGPKNDTDAHIANCCTSINPEDHKQYTNHNKCAPEAGHGQWDGCQIGCGHAGANYGCYFRKSNHIPCPLTPPGPTPKQLPPKDATSGVQTGMCPLLCYGNHTPHDPKEGSYLDYKCPTGYKLITGMVKSTIGDFDDIETPPINSGDPVNDCCVPNCGKLNNDGLVQCPAHTSMVDNASNVFPDTRDPEDIKKKCCPVNKCADILAEEGTNKFQCPKHLLPVKSEEHLAQTPDSSSNEDIQFKCCGVPDYVGTSLTTSNGGKQPLYTFMTDRSENLPIICGKRNSSNKCGKTKTSNNVTNNDIRNFYYDDGNKPKLCGTSISDIRGSTFFKDFQCIIPTGADTTRLTEYPYVIVDPTPGSGDSL